MTEKCEWISVNHLPTLVFDHSLIVEKALQTIRSELNYLPIGNELLPEKCTMSQLQKLHECVLGTQLDRGNFQRKILKQGLLKRHEKQMTGGAHKAPYLYSFISTP